MVDKALMERQSNALWEKKNNNNKLIILTSSFRIFLLSARSPLSRDIAYLARQPRKLPLVGKKG